MGATVPQSVCKFLEDLEHIKKVFLTERECEGTQTSAQKGGSSKKKMVAFSNQIQKTRRMNAKHCILFKQHGGTHNTHNFMECRKYEKDGTPKRPSQGNATSAIHAVRMRHMSMIIPTCSCPQKL
jgi:hypothetical protein